MKTTIELFAFLLRATQRAASAARGRFVPFKLRDASVDGHGLQPGMDGLSWEAQRALAYGQVESSK